MTLKFKCDIETEIDFQKKKRDITAQKEDTFQQFENGYANCGMLLHQKERSATICFLGL